MAALRKAIPNVVGSMLSGKLGGILGWTLAIYAVLLCRGLIVRAFRAGIATARAEDAYMRAVDAAHDGKGSEHDVLRAKGKRAVAKAARSQVWR